MEEPESGVKLKLNQRGNAEVIPEEIGESGFRGSPEQLKAHAVAWFRRKLPNWPVKPLEDFYDDHSRTSFSYVGIRFVKNVHHEGVKKIKITSERDPDARLVFKILYEFLAIIGFLDDDQCREYLRSLVTIGSQGGTKTIELSDEIGSAVISNTETQFRTYNQLEDIPFQRYHWISLMMSPDRNVYAMLTLFGQIKCMLPFMNVGQIEWRFMRWLNKCLMLPIDSSEHPIEPYPNIPNKTQANWADSVVDYRVSSWEDHIE